MIKQSPYLPKQMNGPVVNSVMQALDSRLEDADFIEKYLHDLSINTAEETELENIGRLIGYVRPIVPEAFNAENLFVFGDVPIQNDPEIGFATAGGSVGGVFSAAGSSVGSYMSLGTYRKFLDKISYIKRYGLTLKSVDAIAALVSTDYEIQFTENSDIEIIYGGNIGYRNLWILSQLFNRVATVPQVLITIGEEE